MRKWVCC